MEIIESWRWLLGSVRINGGLGMEGVGSGGRGSQSISGADRDGSGNRSGDGRGGESAWVHESPAGTPGDAGYPELYNRRHVQ